MGGLSIVGHETFLPPKMRSAPTPGATASRAARRSRSAGLFCSIGLESTRCQPSLNAPHAGGQPLILALGKNRKAYRLDRNNLGGIGGQLAAGIVSDRRITASPAAGGPTEAVLQ